MSKAHKPKHANPNEVIWLPENNFGRHKNLFDSPKETCAHAVMLFTGWFTEAFVKVVALTDATRAKALEYLESRWKVLSEQIGDETFPTEGTVTKVSAAQLREAFKARWFKGDKIDVSRIKYEAVYAFQRGFALDYANALRMAKGEKLIDTIPVIEMEYDNLAERIADCILENTGKTAGFKDMSNHWPSLIKTASAYYEASGKNATLSEITKLVTGGDVGSTKVGRGQKAFAILVLDGKFPNLGIVNKIVNSGIGELNGKKDVDIGQVYGESLSRGKMLEFEKNSRVGAEEPVDAADVEEYFADPSANKPVNVAPMNKSALKTRMDRTPNNLAKFILHCVLNNKVETLAKLDTGDIAAECNKVAESHKLEVK